MTTRVLIKADNGKKVGHAQNDLVARIIQKGALDIEGNASVNAQKMIYDQPEDPRRPRTGNLLNSIGSDPIRADRLRWKVYCQAEYAAYVNFGTVRRGARPFFSDAVDKVGPVVLKALRQVLL